MLRAICKPRSLFPKNLNDLEEKSSVADIAPLVDAHWVVLSEARQMDSGNCCDGVLHEQKSQKHQHVSRCAARQKQDLSALHQQIH